MLIMLCLAVAKSKTVRSLGGEVKISNNGPLSLRISSEQVMVCNAISKLSREYWLAVVVV